MGGWLHRVAWLRLRRGMERCAAVRLTCSTHGPLMLAVLCGYRDLKANNIFMSANQIVKLGDFGIAKILQHADCTTQSFVGTPNYVSPEICSAQSYGAKSDVWSLG